MPNSRLTFGLDSEQEDRFRQTHLPADIAQARICIWLILAAVAAFTVNDFSFFGLSWLFHAFMAMRLAIVVHTALLLRILRKVTSYRAYDRAEFAWGLCVAVFSITIAASRPQAFFAHIIVTVVAVFITLLAIPNRFVNQLILSLAYLVGETGGLSCGRPGQIRGRRGAAGEPGESGTDSSAASACAGCRPPGLVALRSDYADRGLGRHLQGNFRRRRLSAPQ